LLTMVAATTKSKRTAEPIQPESKWVEDFDVAGFKKDIHELGAKLGAQQGPDDITHVNKIILWSNLCTVGGVLSAGLSPMWLFPSVLLSVGIFSRWTMVAHHTCHGGYDKLPIQGGRFNRFKFGVGSVWRRTMDWFDWMLPEAWNVEHNNLHHYHLGEDSDPDLLERNMQDIRAMNAPMWQKYAAVTFVAATWKWFYYSPNTFKELKMKEMRKKKQAIVSTDHANPGSDWTPEMAITWAGILTPNYLPSWWSTTEYLTRVFIPYAVYRFEKHCRPRSGEFYLRQVISSADFAAGDDVTDFLHGWLNYQIEHHLWPDLSMLSYQKSMPEVKKICKKYGVPYIQESVWTRLVKTVDIMVGKTSMRQYPFEYENPAADTRKVGEKEVTSTAGHSHSH